MPPPEYRSRRTTGSSGLLRLPGQDVAVRDRLQLRLRKARFARSLSAVRDRPAMAAQVAEPYGERRRNRAASPPNRQQRCDDLLCRALMAQWYATGCFAMPRM